MRCTSGNLPRDVNFASGSKMYTFCHDWIDVHLCELATLQENCVSQYYACIESTGICSSKCIIQFPVLLNIQATAMRAAYRLIRLNLWENNGCKVQSEIEELLAEPNSIHMLWSYPEMWKIVGETRIPRICRSFQAEQGSGGGVSLSNKNERVAFPLRQYTIR